MSAKPPKPDAVNHPPHYNFGRFEVIEVLDDWFATDPLLWQVVKYLARAEHKGNMLQDLRKAEFYLKRRIEKRALYEKKKRSLSPSDYVLARPAKKGKRS